MKKLKIPFCEVSSALVGKYLFFLKKNWRFSYELSFSMKLVLPVREEVSVDNIIALFINKLSTRVEGDPKAPFSIATTERCRGGHYSFPWIAPLYPCSLPYNAEC